MLVGLSGSADHLDSLELVHFQESLQHSFWKFAGLSTMWKTFPTSNGVQLIEKQVSKKKKKIKILCPVCTPTSLDPISLITRNERSDWK